MTLKIHKLNDEESDMTATVVTERIYLTSDKRVVVPEGDERASFLLAPPGPVSKAKADEIAGYRFGSNYLADPDTDTEPETVEYTEAVLNRKNKKKLVKLASDEFDLDLDQDDGKPTLVEAILDAQKAAKSADQTADKSLDPGSDKETKPGDNKDDD